MEGSWVAKGTWLNFGGSLDHQADFSIKNPANTQQIMSGFRLNVQDSSAVIKFWGDLDHHADSTNRESSH